MLRPSPQTGERGKKSSGGGVPPLEGEGDGGGTHLWRGGGEIIGGGKGLSPPLEGVGRGQVQIICIPFIWATEPASIYHLRTVYRYTICTRTYKEMYIQSRPYFNTLLWDFC